MKNVIPYNYRVTQTGEIQFFDCMESISEVNEKALINYLNNVYKDLCSRSAKFSKFGINKYTFLSYTNIPGIIGDKLFDLFDEEKDNLIRPDSFVKHLLKCYTGTFDEKLKFVFDLYDFNHSGTINKEDVKILLMHCPIQNEKDKNLEGSPLSPKYSREVNNISEGKLKNTPEQNLELNDRIENQKKIEELVHQAFQDKLSLTFQQFKEVVSQFSSDMFVSIYNLIRRTIPIQNQLPFIVDKMKIRKNNKASPLIATPKVLTKTISVMKMIENSPSKKITPDNGNYFHTTFSTALSKFVQSKKTEEEKVSTDIFKFNLANIKCIKQSKVKLPPIKYTDSPSVFKIVANISTFFNKKSPSVAQLKPLGNEVDKNFESKVFCALCNSELSDQNSCCNECSSKASEISHSGYLYTDGPNKTYRKKWIVLKNKDIFVYDDSSSPAFQSIICLTGSFLKDFNLTIEMGKGKYYHAFEICFPYSKKMFLVEKENEKNIWTKNLIKAIGMSSITEFYQFLEPLGRGKFGIVRESVHLKTNKIVAIKILKKIQMKQIDYDSIRNENEILGLCQHPNIIKVYDLFENYEYFFIVMEKAVGGDLFSYLEKRNFKLSEDEAKIIIRSISSAIQYLHKHGIIHRDLKSENIMICTENDLSSVKIIDFGLAKMIGEKEKSEDPFGTVGYVAPEILLRIPYGKSVDIWSLGILSCLLLAGYNPFESDSDDQTALNTVDKQVDFSIKNWANTSDVAKDLVLKLLEKDCQKRISIDEVMEHNFFS